MSQDPIASDTNGAGPEETFCWGILWKSRQVSKKATLMCMFVCAQIDDTLFIPASQFTVTPGWTTGQQFEATPSITKHRNFVVEFW